MKQACFVRAVLVSVCVAIIVLVSVHPDLAEQAVSAAPSATFTVNSKDDFPDSNPGDGICDYTLNNGRQCSLRAAIEEANARTGADTIEFDTGYIHKLTVETLRIKDDLTINGSASLPVTTIDAEGNFTALIVESNIYATIENVIIIDGSSTFYGGAIINQGTLNLNSSVITQNFAEIGGGGIFNSGFLYLRETTVSENSTNGTGGGISNGNVVSLFDSFVLDNTAVQDGGGIQSNGGASFEAVTSLNNSRVAGNSSAKGGGVSVWDGSLFLKNGEIEDNRATDAGGGIYAITFITPGDQSLLSITASSVNNNRLTGGAGKGGGMYVEEVVVNFSSSELRENEATFGGGIYGVVGTANGTGRSVEIGRSLIYANQASTGAGLQLVGASGSVEDVLIWSSTIGANTASVFGGGIVLDGLGKVTLAHLTVAYNEVTGGGQGAGIWLDGGVDLAMRNSVVYHRSGAGDACTINSGTMLSASGNLSDDMTCLPVSTITSADMELALLADNGGETETYLPAPNSPLVDSGNDGYCYVVDQRNLPRANKDGNGDPNDSNSCDVGAVERQNPFEYAIYLPFAVSD